MFKKSQNLVNVLCEQPLKLTKTIELLRKMSHRVYQIADVAGRQYIIPSTVVKQQEPDLASVPQPSQVSILGVESLLHYSAWIFPGMNLPTCLPYITLKKQNMYHLGSHCLRMTYYVTFFFGGGGPLLALKFI